MLLIINKMINVVIERSDFNVVSAGKLVKAIILKVVQKVIFLFGIIFPTKHLLFILTELSGLIALEKTKEFILMTVTSMVSVNIELNPDRNGSKLI